MVGELSTAGASLGWGGGEIPQLDKDRFKGGPEVLFNMKANLLIEPKHLYCSVPRYMRYVRLGRRDRFNFRTFTKLKIDATVGLGEFK